MPARSQAQRGYLAVHFGEAWMRKHHFDNKGKLPQHTPKHKRKHPADAFLRAKKRG